MATVEGHQRGDVEVREHIAIDHEEGAGDAHLLRSEADGPCGVERLWLDGIVQGHSSALAVRVGLEEAIGKVAEREDRLVYAVGGQLSHDPLEHRYPHDREHLLRCRQGQRSQPRSLAANKDHSLHCCLLLGLRHRRGGRRRGRRHRQG